MFVIKIIVESVMTSYDFNDWLLFYCTQYNPFKENGRDTEINVVLYADFLENVEHIAHFEYM